MKRKTLASFRLAVVALRQAMEQAEAVAAADHTPLPSVGLREALLEAERVRAAMDEGWRTLGDAHELAALDAELIHAYRRAIALSPPPATTAMRFPRRAQMG
jgi:hypothetical protein